ncbi:MAG: histidine--tRNA ligase [Bacteroidales bacterium]|nr:histidine--tRNA ligase [Bacteroidales bacterium]
MSVQKPSIPKGTRDFLPSEMVKRYYIFDTIKNVFRKYGYLPIETPAMENLDTLLGKYGEEGDRLLFKILNSGNFLKNIGKEDLKTDSNKLSARICEKGLRYDLTVPFARFVVQNLNDITFPFKRYQIKPVWRADKPQKGRYREFFQCDADVIGSNSLLNEVELIQIIDEVFTSLGIKSVVKINNRKILEGIAENIGTPDKLNDITTALDKLDKVGTEKVISELRERNLPDSAIGLLKPFMQISGKTSDRLGKLSSMLLQTATGRKGIEEIQTLLQYMNELAVGTETELDLTLARGLDYYTGIIIEVTAKDVEIGSICGGGRYDDLTGIFGLPDVSGVGISFGADRIYDVLNQLNLFPQDVVASSRLLFVNFGKTETFYCLKMLDKLRKRGISAEIYPEPAKLKKQMSYANSKGIAYVALVGENEIKEEKITLKEMNTGLQSSVNFEKLSDILIQKDSDQI